MAERLGELSTAACDLELDLATGRRGDRDARASQGCSLALTGAEAALAVRTTARAALVLALAALAAGREVIVSRGELVEIGGSFRIPEILAAAGARLVEVGTHQPDARSRLRARDRAGDRAAAQGAREQLPHLRVRRRGRRRPGSPGSRRRRGLPLLVDEGAACSRAASRRARRAGSPGIRASPSSSPPAAISSCGSGDKLLGGPQAGLLPARRELVERCARHPLYRALRPDRAARRRARRCAAPAPDRRRAAARPPLAGAAAHRARLERRSRRGSAPRSCPATAFVGGGAAPESADRRPGARAVRVRCDAGLRGRLRRGGDGLPPVVGCPARRAFLARSAHHRSRTTTRPSPPPSSARGVAPGVLAAQGNGAAAPAGCRGSRVAAPDARARALTGEGLRVDAAGDLAAARALLAGRERFDLVLTDLHAARRQRARRARAARARRAAAAAPVVVLTAFGTVAAAVAAMKLGAADFLEKPVDLERALSTASPAWSTAERVAPVFQPAGRAADRRLPSAAARRDCACSSGSRRPRAPCC